MWESWWRINQDPVDVVKSINNSVSSVYDERRRKLHVLIIFYRLGPKQMGAPVHLPSFFFSSSLLKGVAVRPPHHLGKLHFLFLSIKRTSRDRLIHSNSCNSGVASNIGAPGGCHSFSSPSA